MMLFRRPEDLDEWDAFYLRLCHAVRTKSKDPSTKVGAYIARPDHTPVSFGYNGFPRGVNDNPGRYDDREQKYPRTVHAELNAILNSREYLAGCTLYVAPLSPCATCAGAIIQSGVTRVVAEYVGNREDWQRSFDIAAGMFDEAKVKLILVGASQP